MPNLTDAEIETFKQKSHTEMSPYWQEQRHRMEKEMEDRLLREMRVSNKKTLFDELYGNKDGPTPYDQQEADYLNKYKKDRQLMVPDYTPMGKKFDELKAEIQESIAKGLEQLQKQMEFAIVNRVDYHMGGVFDTIKELQDGWHDMIDEWNEFQEDNS